MDKQKNILINRIKEQAQIAYYRDIPMFTDFLNLDEQQTLISIEREIPPVNIIKFGGYEFAERVMVGFIPSYINQAKSLFPLVGIKISKKTLKYSQVLTHRDYLGSVLGLGIDRSKVGDIIVSDNEGYLFCTESVYDYILNNLIKVKNTNVQCDMVESFEDVFTNKKYKVIEGTVASNRLDAIAALGFSKSRNQIIPFIKNGKVYVNSKQILSSNYILNEGDYISIRHFGKIIYVSTNNITKKGRYFIVIHKLV